MKIPKANRARNGVKNYRNGMNSRSSDLGQRESNMSPLERRRYKKYAGKRARKNARYFCKYI